MARCDHLARRFFIHEHLLAANVQLIAAARILYLRIVIVHPAFMNPLNAAEWRFDTDKPYFNQPLPRLQATSIYSLETWPVVVSLFPMVIAVESGRTLQNEKRDIVRWLKNLLSKPTDSKVQSVVCTVSFTNMADYGVIAATMSLNNLPTFMNRYFDTHESAIRGNGGVICQIFGDNIMAIWSADDSAQAACESALDQCSIMSEFVSWAKGQGHPSPDFRIGINTGRMNVCTGPPQNQLTVLGDAVNLAARLDKLNKSYGTQILISEFTRSQLSARLVARPVDVVRVKGLKNPLKLFELCGRAADIKDESREFLDAYDTAFAKYLDSDFESAIGNFEFAKKHRQSDLATDQLIARCRYLIENPPGAQWDGVLGYRVQ